MAYSYGEIELFIKNNNCELLTPREEYKNAKQKLRIKCGRCGNEFKQSFKDFRCSIHKACRKCRYFLGGQKKAKTTEEFKQEIYELEGGKYNVIGEYINAKTKVKMRHNECSYEYYVLPRAFLEQGHRCPSCNPKKKKSHEEFCNELFELVGNEYTVLDKYEGAMVKIKILHNKCGYIWDTIPNNILQGTRCPSCYRSKGEERIAEILDSINIKYKEEYIFDNCRYINPLPFDFYLPDYNMCIEYDGIQHFEPCGFGEKDDDEIYKKFKRVQKRDKIKNQYCKDNNIELLRIPYYKYENIEKILKNSLKIKKIC